MKKFLKVIGLYALMALLVSLLSCSPEKVTKSGEEEFFKAPFEMRVIEAPIFPDRVFNIMDFGAVNDSISLIEHAFSDAISACNEAGGGMVFVPKGKWLTVPIELKSNVNLYLDSCATVIFTSDKQYFFRDSVSRKLGDLSNPISPIYANNCTNIAITGSGTLDGNGLGWWPLQDIWWNQHKSYFPQELFETAWEGVSRSITPEISLNMQRSSPVSQSFPPDPKFIERRPKMLQPVNCSNILFEGIKIINSPMWTINPVMCENLIIRNVTIRATNDSPNPWTPNTDGINPESCKNVLIENCDIDTGDDSFAIKSGKDKEGRERGKPSQNIIIRNCIAKRISIGSEMSGGIRNVYVHDIKILGNENRMIHLKTRRGRGGVVENIWMENISADSVSSEAVLINMTYWNTYDPAPYEPVSERTPKFRNIHFRNISCRSAGTPVSILGLSEMPVDSISFSNIHIGSKNGIICRNAQHVKFDNIQMDVLNVPAFLIDSCMNLSVLNTEIKTDFTPSIIIKNRGSRNINLSGNLKGIAFEDGADSSVLK